MSIWKIDGQSFNLPPLGVDCKADFLDKYAERTEDGDLKRELIGVYFNYTVKLGRAKDPAEYTRLWNKLTEPVEFHTFSLPLADGYFEFTGYVANPKSSLKKLYEGHLYWDGITFDVVGKTPARK